MFLIYVFKKWMSKEITWITMRRANKICTFCDVILYVAFNSMAPGRPGWHFQTAIFNAVLLIAFSRFSNDNAPR